MLASGAETTSDTQATNAAVLDTKMADAARIAALESEVQVFRDFT